MWRRTYLFLILVRLFFALSPSYLHPDENFQGPEVIAGRVFSYPVHVTWEFTSENPIRSSFPLWLGYGVPMYILHLLWGGTGSSNVVPPRIVYWTLRAMMFILTFVLEDGAIQELVQNPRHRRVAVLLVASSYVTWTLQTHTFSNSFETLLLLWSLVLIGRIVNDRKSSGALASSTLAFLTVLGTFNRITFPAFLLIPSLRLIPHFQRKPFSLVIIIIVGLTTAALAVTLDTAFYNPDMTFSTLFHQPIITPLNNILYNTQASNLAEHGLHPFYQHLVANLPQLLGPAFPLLFFSYRKTWHLASAVCGVLLLSIFPHQEARFLLPAVPLILSSVRLPVRFPKAWVYSWVLFNAVLGVLMGIYHQGGVVPASIHLGTMPDKVTDVFWWKTYSPPVWLLDGKNSEVTTHDLMGMPGDKMLERVVSATSCDGPASASHGMVLLVAPRSATFLDRYLGKGTGQELELDEIWSSKHHLNLDDMDFGDDGVWPTLQRVIGRRGLVIRRVRRYCGTTN